MFDDVGNQRIPVISWECGTGTTFAAVAAGSYNTLITNTAIAVKNFGYPMFIRWAWEMNFSTGASGSCEGTSSTPQTDFINAWQTIYNIFKAQGVTNVAWLWNPGGAGGTQISSAIEYYPGTNYVDWIGFDGYDEGESGNFGGVFNAFYTAFLNYGKPFLVGETAACQYLQTKYLASAQTQIDGTTTSSFLFPNLRGFMYWDSIGPYHGCSDGSYWTFSTAGINAFAAMGADPYFSAPTGL